MLWQLNETNQAFLEMTFCLLLHFLQIVSCKLFYDEKIDNWICNKLLKNE